MAVIPLQGTQERSAWSQLMEKYPTVALVLQCIGDLVGYFANGQFLVDAWRWAVLTAGNVSEAALMFAALWITAASVEPDAINHLPYGIPAMLSAGSMFALTLLPEIIVYHAIATCYEYWRNTVTEKGNRIAYWPWAVLYSIPTIAFLVMTIITLCSFVSIGHTFTAPTWLLTARVLSGWSYGVIGLIHAAIHRKSPVKTEPTPVLNVAATIPVSTPQPTLPQAQISEAPAEVKTEQVAEVLATPDQADSVPPTVPQDEPTTDPEIEAITELPGNNDGNEDGTEITDECSAISSAAVPQINIATRRKSLTTAEVSEVLNCSERYVRTLRTQGKLAKDEKDENLITAASVRAFLKTKTPLQG